MTKRQFLGVVIAGAGAALAAPLPAWAQRIRILPGQRAVDDVVTTGAVSREFQRLAATVRVGEAQGHGALRAFWLRAGAMASPLEVVTLEEARARGDLTVAERADATVPALVVENRGAVHALLMAGEILVGGKQNRVITEDILLPPKSGPRDLAVYCVEQGRWAATSAGFESRGSFAAPKLRARLLERERASQDRVWAEVQMYSRSASAPSPTSSYQAIHDKPEVRKHQQDVAHRLASRVPVGTQGAAVFAGETLLGLDLFQDGSLFARQWPKLLGAHAVDVYGSHSPTIGDEATQRRRVEELLRRAASTEGTLRANAGTGRLFEFRLEGLHGAALIAADQAIHTALL